MDSNIIKQDINKVVDNELANLKNVNEISNHLNLEDDGIIVSTTTKVDVSETAELWANLCSIQQIAAPERYAFNNEERNWRLFVTKKTEKKSNILLVAKAINNSEIKGFLYLQTITLPSSELILKGVIEDIYTKPQYRRERIATKLLSSVCFWAKTQNIKSIDLICLSSAKDLLTFYSKFLNKPNISPNLEILII